jgi:chromosome segregation ATPase
MQPIQKIFLLDDKIENKALFFICLGPLFLLLSASIAKIDLIILSAISLLLIYRFLKAGLIISSAFLVIYMAKNHLYTTSHVYDLGIELSVFLGFLISAFSFDEAKDVLNQGSEDLKNEIEKLRTSSFESSDKLDEHKRSNLENLSKLKLEYDQKEEENLSLKIDIQKLTQSLEEEKERKDIIEYEKSIKDKKLKEKDDEIEALYNKLNELTKNKNTINLKDSQDQNIQIEKLNKNIEELHNEKNTLIERVKSLNNTIENNLKEITENKAQESIPEQDISKFICQVEALNKIIKEKDSLIEKIKNEKKSLKNHDNEEELKKLKEINHLYLQLKDQFNEKTELLSQARKDLFEAKEKLIAIIRENKSDFSDLNEIEKQLIEDLKIAVGEIEITENENEILNSLIIDLITKKVDKDSNKLKGDQLDFSF